VRIAALEPTAKSEEQVSDVRQRGYKRAARGHANSVDYPDRLLDVHEAAVILGLKATTLYQWAYERRIPIVKLSGSRGPLRFRLTTLLKIIEESERPALRSATTSGGSRGFRGR
jgi:excisionase family DNA binding protein